MNLLEKVEHFIIGDVAISQSAIADAIYAYRYRFAEMPTTLVLHPVAYRKLLEELDRTYLDLNTVMGLQVEPSLDISNGEWRVGARQEIVEAWDVTPRR